MNVNRNHFHEIDGSELYRHRIRGCPDHESFLANIAETPITTRATTTHAASIPYGLPFLLFRLLADRTLVESQLLTLEDVTVDTAALARARGNDGVQATGLKLALDSTLNLALVGVAGGLLLLDRLALLLLRDIGLLLTATADALAVVGLVPLTEGGSVDLDDGRLGQGVCADQLVVGGVEGDTEHTGLAGDTLGAPREVAGLETESTVLLVTTTGADQVDALGTDTGVGGLATLLKSSVGGDKSDTDAMVKEKHPPLFTISHMPSPRSGKKTPVSIDERSVPLLAVESALSTSGAALVARIARDTHICG